ncbi:aldose epimerase family protein [Virgibacillus sp. DJP39]|uniref:aldose epimerase family protein n=1 Tax=Virgibacillus sp. DJP39 TaxID=3409790 RepID=UPI003BB72BB2
MKKVSWEEFTLVNDNGMEVSCLNYGGVITKILTPDQSGNVENVVLGYRDYADYISNPNFFGALIGRVAGRVEDASFTLDEHVYQLQANDGKNQLHSGDKGFHQVVWDVETFKQEGKAGLILSHFIADEEDGYPGNLEMKVIYTLDNSNNFSITYQGEADKKTALTATNHTYFNLSGNLRDTILDHHVTLDSCEFLELDEALIPTGKKLRVADSVFDFRKGRLLKDGSVSDCEQNKIASNGYDHYFIFDKKSDAEVVVKDFTSGRKMSIKTDQPGVVVYSGNGLDDQHELAEGKSGKHLGVCFETQASPASLHGDGFPTCILNKGEVYYYTTTFQFGLID